jgi:hypothetical protein
LRVGPEAECHADRPGAGAQEGDGAVDSAAHRHRHPARCRSRAEDRAESVRERVDRQRLAADRGGLDEAQPAHIGLEPVGVHVDDALAVQAKADEGPAPVPGRVSRDLDHGVSVPHPADASAP